MKRYVVVLAEERSTIETLLTRAVLDKLGDAESFRVARNEDDLWRELDERVTVLLLSSTFSRSSHNEFIQTVLTEYPSLRIISLTNRFGDRSSMEYGAFEVIDKPVRNPVLWAKMDKAFEDYDTSTLHGVDNEDIPFGLEISSDDKNTSEKSEESNSLLHVEHFNKSRETTKNDTLLEDEDDDVVVLEPKKTYPIPNIYESAKNVDVDEDIVLLEKDTPKSRIFESPPSSSVVVDDDEDEDDLFGVPSSTQSKPRIYEPSSTPVIAVSPIVKEDIPVISKTQEEQHLELTEESENETDSLLLTNEAEESEEPEEIDKDSVPFGLEDEEEEQQEEQEEQEEQEAFSLPDLEDSSGILEKDEDKEEFFSLEEETESDSQENEEIPDTSKDSSLSMELEEVNEIPTPPPGHYDSSDSQENSSSTASSVGKNLVLSRARRISKDKVMVEMPEKPAFKAKTEEVEPPSNTLEPENEIFSETDRYDEKSEWIEANEGFVAKNGEFVSLAPPRTRLRNVDGSGVDKGKKVDSSSGDSVGLFGSVKNLFKK